MIASLDQIHQECLQALEDMCNRRKLIRDYLKGARLLTKLVIDQAQPSSARMKAPVIARQRRNSTLKNRSFLLLLTKRIGEK